MILRFWNVKQAGEGDGYVATQYQQGQDGRGQTVEGPTGREKAFPTRDEMHAYLRRQAVTGEPASSAMLAREKAKDPMVLEVWW